jgi:hypothetical protein
VVFPKNFEGIVMGSKIEHKNSFLLPNDKPKATTGWAHVFYLVSHFHPTSSIVNLKVNINKLISKY